MAQTESWKTLSDNRQASHNFFLFDRYEAGMALTGTEVKAAKSGKVQLRDAYAMIDNNEAWLHNAHISEYSHGNRENHTPVRVRKLLLHRREIDKLLSATREKGLSLIPTRMYLKNGKIKCEIALAPGLDACPANGAIVAAPVTRARTAHELQGLLSARDRFAAWRNRPMLCRERELMMQGAPASRADRC